MAFTWIFVGPDFLKMPLSAKSKTEASTGQKKAGRERHPRETANILMREIFAFEISLQTKTINSWKEIVNAITRCPEKKGA